MVKWAGLMVLCSVMVSKWRHAILSHSPGRNFCAHPEASMGGDGKTNRECLDNGLDKSFTGSSR